MPSTHKKVVVKKMSRDILSGYVSPAAFIEDGQLEVMNTHGNLVRMSLSDIKCVYFVRDFNEPETFARKTFTTRPRTEGLWVRLRFKDNDILEGLMANDLNQISADGYMVNPPDTRGNTQKIFVPRAALTALNVLAVIGGMQGRRRAVAEPVEQEKLFRE